MKIYYHTTLGGILSQAELVVRNAGVNVDVDNANEAVDGINVEGGLEAVRDDANPNIPIVRVQDLGISRDKIAGDAVDGTKAADGSFSIDHLDADLTERICPDPSTGSSGQVCARNTAGTAYELVTPSGGGGGGGGGGGSGYGDWASIGSVTGSISGNPVTVALNANETIDDYEELYLHIEANNANDQRVASGRFRVSDVPTTTLAGGGLGIPFAGNATDEGAVLVRRNADGDSLVLDVYGSVINFPATAVTTIYARELTAGGGGTSVEVDGVVVGYVAGTRTLGVEVEQDNGTDFSGTTVLPLVTATNAGLLPTTGRICPDPSTGTAGQVCSVNAAGDGFELTGGGAGSTDRVVLLDGETYTPGAARNFDFDSEVQPRTILTFLIEGTADGSAIMLSDDFLSLPAQASSPATTAGAYVMVARNTANSLPTNNQGNNWMLWREDDDSIYFRDSRGSGGSLTVTATPLGGGPATGGQQATSGLQTTQIFDRDAAAAALTVYPLGTALSAGNDNHFTFVEVDKESLDRVEIMILVDTQYYLPISITREMLWRTTPQAGHPGSITNTEDCGCYFLSGRTTQSADSREPPVMDPLWGWIDNRRLASRYGIVIWLDDNPAGTDWRGLHIYVFSSQDMHIAAGYVYHF